MLEKNGEFSLFKTEKQKATYLASYDRVMTELWPVPYDTVDVSTRAGTTHVIISGPSDGEPVVLLHGGGGPSTMWYSMVGDLVEAGYRVYAPDRVGDVGKSTIRELPEDRQSLANWLLDTLDALNLGKPAMIGLSYGSFMNINFASIHPDRIEKIIMLTPGGVFSKLRLWFILRMTLSFMTGFEPLMRNAARWISGGHTHDSALMDQSLLGWRIVNGPDYMPPVFSDEELASIKHPSLLLVGDRDVIYNPGKVLQRASNTMPNVETGLIEGGGHTLSTDVPQVVNQRILKFLADTGPE